MKYKPQSILASDINEYLKYRKAFGYRSDCDYSNLCVFDKYLASTSKQSVLDLDERFFLEMMAIELEELKPQTVNARLVVLKSFFHFLERGQKLKHNPTEFLPRVKELYYSPHFFGPSEIRSILAYMAQRAAKAAPRSYLFRLARYTGFALQAACGMRISEVANLRLSDFCSREHILFIRQTKFRKDRMIPISEKTSLMIANYLSARSALKKDRSPYLLIGYHGSKGNRSSLGWYFAKIMRELKMSKKPEIKGTTIFGSPNSHSLRHSFAINTIRRWSAEGKDIDKVCDTLATYMGHADFAYTQIYLKGLSQVGPLIFNKDVLYQER